MTPTTRVLLGLLAVLTALAGATALAQTETSEFEAPPSPVSLLRATSPMLTVSYQGEFGPMRITGVLAQAPEAPLTLLDPEDRERSANWLAIRALSVVRNPREGSPRGSFSVTLSSDEGALPRTVRGLAGAGAASRYGARGSGGPSARPWRLTSLPKGEVVLRGKPYGSITIPLESIEDWTVIPLSGTISELPPGLIRVQVAQNLTVSLPLQEVETLRRDMEREFISVLLVDGQVFSGKLRQLPNVRLSIRVGTGTTAVPLAEVVQLEVMRVPLGIAASTTAQ